MRALRGLSASHTLLIETPVDSHTQSTADGAIASHNGRRQESEVGRGGQRGYKGQGTGAKEIGVI